MFTKQETKGLAVIFLLLILASVYSFRQSYKRERDVQRNLDVSAIAAGVRLYRSDYRVYPGSMDGMIAACRGEETRVVRDEIGSTVFREGAKKPVLENLVPCPWGESALLDINDINYPQYLSRIPDDPKQNNGFSYLYLSNGQDFQIYGSFEARVRMEYDPEIKKLGLLCGKKICNFGKASRGVTLYEPLR